MNDPQGEPQMETELEASAGTLTVPGERDRGPGPRPSKGAGPGLGPSSGPGTPDLFDHEKLHVYRVAREFFLVVEDVLRRRKMPKETHEQLDTAAQSILARIAEGAGKTARADKRRFYEMARGSATETAAHLDILQMRDLISPQEYAQARALLLRIVKMLSRLCAGPRTT